MQLVSPFGLSKRPFIHMDQPFIVFFVQSFIFFKMNVEKEHLLLDFGQPYCNLSSYNMHDNLQSFCTKLLGFI